MKPVMEMKKCSKCGLEKSRLAFDKDRKAKDGLQSHCKSCKAETDRDYYQDNRTEILEQQQKYARTDVGKAVQSKADKKRRSTIRGYLEVVFNNMNQRCNNPKADSYKYYGARGIENKFKSFDVFYKYVVEDLKVDPRGKPSLQIDRINNEGDYERGNIRFVTAKVNCQNRRPCKKKK